MTQKKGPQTTGHSFSQNRQNYNTASRVIDRLESVRESGANQWTAVCPAHEDKSPSLRIKELENGRVLLHCFAGCPAESILSAINLNFKDLYPPQNDFDIREWKRSKYREVYQNESLIVEIYKADELKGKNISPSDKARATLATRRIRKIEHLYGGRP